MEKFSLEVNGYNREEVNNFISSLLARNEGLVDLCSKQQQELASLQKELYEYKSSNDKSTIINDAKMMSSRILNESLLKADEIDKNNELLKKNMGILMRRMNVLIDQEKAILKEFDDLGKME